MALATTCPQCKTSFRVVPDQLKLRRGFVRCGRCRHVFAGIDHLRYVDDAQLRTDARAAAAAPASIRDAGDPDAESPERAADAIETLHPAADDDTDEAHDTADARDIDDAHGIDGTRDTDDAHGIDDARSIDGSGDTDGLHGAVGHEDEWLVAGTPDFPSVPDEALDDEAPAAAAAPHETDASAAPRPHRVDDSGSVHADERFAPENDDGESAIDYFSTRRSRGFADRGRLAAGAVALVLVTALALQWIVAQRATIATHVPVLAPVLGAVLAPFGLRVGAPNDLDALTIESFEMRASAVPDVLEMRALLRNRADHPVRWPSMRLTLTDRSNRVLVSRTLDPDDYLAEAPVDSGRGVPPRTEWPLRLALETRDLQLTGYDYRVRLFYP